MPLSKSLVAAGIRWGAETSERTNAVIVCLKPGQTIPIEPGVRYLDPTGYVNMRWRIWPNIYIQLAEHRWLMGNPHGDVHHKNGDRADNRLENLEVLHPSVHRSLHAKRKVGRVELEIGRRMYGLGATTTEIGARFGVDESQVSRGLRKIGVPMRTCSETHAFRKTDACDIDRSQRVHTHSCLNDKCPNFMVCSRPADRCIEPWTCPVCLMDQQDEFFQRQAEAEASRANHR